MNNFHQQITSFRAQPMSTLTLTYFMLPSIRNDFRRSYDDSRNVRWKSWQNESLKLYYIENSNIKWRVLSAKWADAYTLHSVACRCIAIEGFVGIDRSNNFAWMQNESENCIQMWDTSHRKCFERHIRWFC